MEMNTIYDVSGNVIGIFRHGVAWRKSPKERLGVYDENNIYDNNNNLLATFDGSKIQTLGHIEIGKIEGEELIADGKVVGKFIGKKCAGAAAIIFFFSELEMPLIK